MVKIVAKAIESPRLQLQAPEASQKVVGDGDGAYVHKKYAQRVRWVVPELPKGDVIPIFLFFSIFTGNFLILEICKISGDAARHF